MSEPSGGDNAVKKEGNGTIVVALGLMTALTAWLWPFGLGEAMPVGGDVTRFQIGLMAYYQNALHAVRLPLWNELWGFGFPGLAESQMGVFYPPHVVLYGLTTLESAYTASLVLHTIWAGWGALWFARRLGISSVGAGIAGWSYAASGFFLIHMSHQWGYSVAAWTPWALGLAWDLGDRQRWADPLKLAMVLAVQMLPGHFQLAFYTQCAVLWIIVWRMIERRRESGSLKGGLLCLGAIAWAMAMAAAQLVPTYELAKLAESTRDPEYLSQFCASPVHLVNFVAPELFHRMPLWRPIAWDPFHTSPEENLTWIGLVPLFLALGAVFGRWRADRDVRLLVALGLFALAMSLGPYLPGFRWYCQLPGFSFFRAPARWNLITLLALAILAGKGWDRLPTWERVGRSLRRFVFISAGLIGLTIALFEAGLWATEGMGVSGVERLYDQMLAALPWSDDPKARDIAKIARSPQTDFRAEVALAREGFLERTPDALTFEKQRWTGYRLELIKTSAWLGALFVVSFFARWPKALQAILLVAMVGEGMSFRNLRGVDEAPLASLADNSRVLDMSTGKIFGGRVWAPDLKNLPMVVGAGTVDAYRTLDLPSQQGMLGVVQGVFSSNDSERRRGEKAMDDLYLGDILIEPSTVLRSPDLMKKVPLSLIADPQLVNWLYGRAWVEAGKRRDEFAVFIHDARTPNFRVDLVIDGEEISAEKKLPLWVSKESPEDVIYMLELNEMIGAKHALLRIPQLYYPRWRAEWAPLSSRGSPPEPLQVHRTPEGWMSVEIPRPELGAVRLWYDGSNVYIGMAISGVAWLSALGLWSFVSLRLFVQRRRNRKKASGI